MSQDSHTDRQGCGSGLSKSSVPLPDPDLEEARFLVRIQILVKIKLVCGSGFPVGPDSDPVVTPGCKPLINKYTLNLYLPKLKIYKRNDFFRHFVIQYIERKTYVFYQVGSGFFFRLDQDPYFVFIGSSNLKPDPQYCRQGLYLAPSYRRNIFMLYCLFILCDMTRI